MKLQIILERGADFAATATLMAESADAGFVAVASTPLYSPDFQRIISGWQALGGLLSAIKPRAAAATTALLARYHVVTLPTPQDVLWTSEG